MVPASANTVLRWSRAKHDLIAAGDRSNPGYLGRPGFDPAFTPPGLRRS
jgi:hypothetical protein